MKTRKLRIVKPDEPQGYGQGRWGRLPHTPTADELVIRCRAQSLLSRDGKRAELPDIETARRILAEQEEKK